MGRSSYAVQSLSGVANAAAQAQADIWRQQTEAENEIEDQRTQLAQQLQSTLAGYETEQAKDTLKRVQEMEETDYDRNVSAAERQTNIAQQLYTNLYQQQRDTVADAQWLREQNEAIRQFNIEKKYTPESGQIMGTGTNTSADTYYDVNETEKKSGGGGGGSSSTWKPKKSTKDTSSGNGSSGGSLASKLKVTPVRSGSSNYGYA